ncbi:MAG: hypothetical protein ACRBG0_19220 [Lewinella sp.]|uniref:hypothetical protein n=1 Tax=Lewinella sp. TaxID=2004506 RepID=UPI003D6B60A3
MKLSLSPLTDKLAWWVSARWAKEHKIEEQGQKVAGNEHYTEYVIHYIVKHEPDHSGKLSPEDEAEANRAIQERERILKEL